MTDIDKIIVEREEAYGDFNEMADIVQHLKIPIEAHAHKFTPAQKFALEMIAVKMARLINGNTWHADSWQDIAGYAKLGGGAAEQNRELKMDSAFESTLRGVKAHPRDFEARP